MFNRTKAARELGQQYGVGAARDSAAEVEAVEEATVVTDPVTDEGAEKPEDTDAIENTGESDGVRPTDNEVVDTEVPDTEVPEAELVESVVAAEGAVPTDLEELMRRLEQVTTIASTPGPAPLKRVAGEASEHAQALQATLQAQKQAQRMLALATKVRGQASAQAEQIMREAQETALRLNEEAEREAAQAREETSAWAAVQRRQVEQAVSGLLDAASADADRIRAEAERAALAEAAETSRQYVARVSAAADRDAEAIRAEARDVLSRAQLAAEEAAHSARSFADAIASYLVSIQRQGDRLAEIGRDAAARVAVVAPSEPTAGSADRNATPEAVATGAQKPSPTHQDADVAPEPATDPEDTGTEDTGTEDTGTEDTGTEDINPEDIDAEAELEAELEAQLAAEGTDDTDHPDEGNTEPTAAGAADRTSGQAQSASGGDVPAAWPLGSLFRGIAAEER
ncbi:hypothetical protein P5P86_13595 [Nocardioides sp. BP30]|uniref:hypothetical protein n=1 Tax=Nocardioides sp. BP30 TaxID=3036374 RepID=UPI0024694E5C|nr:hypothetical protein [Nocardioides sp. BP30]WGL50996.1 hypothetical protein P5P86_13595 [Nocardioides sp. BP30]